MRDTEPAGPSGVLVALLAIATGVLVANLYYAQPLIAAIGPALGITPALAGSVVSVTQVGYGVGLFLLVSLADRLENRRLVLVTLGVTVVALLVAATARSAAMFFAASFAVGVCSTGAQVIVPFVAHLAPAARRGRVVGNVMAGLLTGIMLARPAASFVAASFGWRAVFAGSAGLMLVVGAVLARMMPPHAPEGGPSYAQILASMGRIFREMPVVRRRAIYQALLFAAFNIFWTAVPLLLASRFGLGQRGIGLFALAGAGGALAAPLAGRLADRGYVRAATLGAMLTLALCFLGTRWAAAAGALAMLVVLAVVLDAAVQVNQVVGQRVIFATPGEVRGRVNAIYMTILFAGGAVGSTLGSITYQRGGWSLSALAGAGLAALALAFFFTERRGA